MTYPAQAVVVIDLIGGQAVLKVGAGNPLLAELKSFGFVELGDELYAYPIRDASERLRVARYLNELGALFSAGKEWSPAEIMESYLDDGKVRAWKRISWRSPAEYEVEDVCSS